MVNADRSFRRTRIFGGKEYVYFEHRYFERQATQYLKELRDKDGFHARMTKGVIKISGKKEPYYEFWIPKQEYLTWKEKVDRSLFGKHYDELRKKRGYLT